MTARLATRPTVVVPNPYGPTADLDAIIINYRTPQLTGRCVRSWLDYADAHLDAGIRVRLTVVDVDPDPAQPTIAHAQLAGHDVQVLVLPWNAGYSGACNRAAQLTDAPMLAFLNADTRLTNADCIPTMMQFFADHPDDAHIAGPLQVDDRGLVRHGGIFGSQEAPQHRDFGEPVTDLHRTNQRAVTVSGSAYFVRRSTWNKLRDCPLFQEQIDPGCPGAMLRTPHYFEETWVSYHGSAHRQHSWYVGEAEMEHLYDSSPHDDVADTGRLFATSKPIFTRACDVHHIRHD